MPYEALHFYQGRKMTLRELSVETGIELRVLRNRVYGGNMTATEAVAYQPPSYSEDEDAILLAEIAAGRNSAKRAAQRLPRRSLRSVRARRDYLLEKLSQQENATGRICLESQPAVESATSGVRPSPDKRE